MTATLFWPAADPPTAPLEVAGLAEVLVGAALAGFPALATEEVAGYPLGFVLLTVPFITQTPFPLLQQWSPNPGPSFGLPQQ